MTSFNALRKFAVDGEQRGLSETVGPSRRILHFVVENMHMRRVMVVWKNNEYQTECAENFRHAPV